MFPKLVKKQVTKSPYVCKVCRLQTRKSKKGLFAPASKMFFLYILTYPLKGTLSEIFISGFFIKSIHHVS
jgi:hypothetical protein